MSLNLSNSYFSLIIRNLVVLCDASSIFEDITLKL